ncbi:MAG: molybdopterin biosynthesis protein [Syntrophomonadaceae bacterium]|jgi:molybdenum cofactor synthesis domain-containing protein
MERNIYIENMPVEQAYRLFMESLNECGFFKWESEYIDVLASNGRVSSQAILSLKSSPHYVAAAMDGIAVKSSLTFSANENNPIDLKRNRDFIEVDTGDYIPPEFDAVIMIEDVNFILDNARIYRPAIPWQHIRSVGEDLVAHDMIIPGGQLIGPFEIAAFRSAAIRQVPVIKQPRVGIIPTGTELIEEAKIIMAAGEIVESNSYMLSGLCQEWGAVPFRHDIVIDDKDCLREAIAEIKDRADMIVICSGSSAGREDYTSTMIKEFGKVLVHGLAIRPGKPAILGIIDKKPVIGVPGYPVSAQLIFNIFARPVLLRKQGMAIPEEPKLKCNISRKIASSMGVDEYIYVNITRIKDEYFAYPLNRGAGITTSLVKADGILHIPRGNEGLLAGEKCPVILRRSQSIIDNTIAVIGSHDISIDFLADILQSKHGLRLISANVGSMGGLMSLSRSETHCSGIHLLDENSDSYNKSYLDRYLRYQSFILVHIAKRQQGLILPEGNPLQIKSLQDLTRENLRFINRQKGAGTRILLDYMLKKAGIDPLSINGYNREEYTHLAVAAAVKNNAADVGLGIYAAARVMELSFLPLCEEYYDLCILPNQLDKEKLEILLETIAGVEFKNRLNQAGGYNTDLTGKILYHNKY